MMLSDPADRVVRLIGELAVTASADTEPAVDEILDRVRALWWERLSPAERLDAHLGTVHRSPRPTPVDDVLTACRLAAACGTKVEIPEFSSLTCGTVRPGGRGTWTAQIGNRPWGLGHAGDYGSIRAANAAVWDGIEINREVLRDRLRAAGEPLAGIADRGWEEPRVAVWATFEQRRDDDPAFVTRHQIAHRAGVRPARVDRWRGAAGFPEPEAGTSIWYWPAVERWLAGTGRLPAGPADDRPVLARDTRF